MFLFENVWGLLTHDKGRTYATIMKYGEKLESYNLKRFNSNLIDPIKLIFDKSVYRTSWEEIVNNEIFRQRDKSNNNDIGYFHQNIFSYFKGCEVPQSGWDVIYRNPDGIQMPDGDIVHTIYVEMKNKHNTMNSASSAKTYIKMQGQILEDDDCACLLVEAIAKKSQNIKWSTKVDGKNVQHRLIRRVSMDQFYAILTGEEDAFYKMCMALPEVINSVVNEEGGVKVPRDTAKRRIYVDGRFKEVNNVNVYLLDAPNEFICNRSKPLWNVPQMTTGNRPADGGNRLLKKKTMKNL